MDDARVGAALRAVRIRLGWRQLDVATKAGVSPALVSLVERGHLDRLALATLRASPAPRTSESTPFPGGAAATWTGS